MTKPPTQEEIEASPELAAIQALKYDMDDDTPEGELTLRYKKNHSTFQIINLIIRMVGLNSGLDISW